MTSLADPQGANVPLRLLILEDHAPDADLLVTELRRSGFDPRSKRVGSGAEFEESLGDEWDMILADFALPQFDALKALEVLRARSVKTPLIVVTGAVSEEVAVECLKQGAADYLLKDRLTRLSSAVYQALEQRRIREESVRAHEALRANEQRLRALIEHSSNGMLLLNSAGQVMHRYNDLFAPGDNWYSDAFLEWMVPEDRPRVREIWERLGSAVETVQFRVSNGLGVRRVEVICNDLRATAGVGAIVAHYRDVTERHQLEEQFLHAQKMQAVGQLAAGLGHDFNNLLTIISGQCELLATRNDLSERVRDGVLEIQDACQRATALTQELLTFSRKRVNEPRILDLNREISGLTPLLRSLLGEESDLRVDLQDDAGWIRMDESGLQQVIMNLVVNARDAMPGHGVVTIESRKIPHGEPLSHVSDSAVMLTVSDTGCGMDTQTAARIFEPFFTTKDVGKGTGLGLSTVYAIVTNAGGSISVDSEPGKGSAFRALFPSVMPEPAVAASARTVVGSETILLVDDDDRVRKLIAGMLRSAGYGVISASSGEAAIEQWRAADGTINLLLTDVRMPGMKGPELARRLRTERPELKVLLMSAEPVVEDTELRGVSFLAKPTTAKALAAKIRQVLDTTRGQTRVLVVDDNVQIRGLLRETLEAGGYLVEEAGDGKEALAALSYASPNIVVTDIVMPETDGIELIREIRKASGGIKIIAMSGVGGQCYLDGAGVLGADAILTKPLDLDALLESVRSLSAQTISGHLTSKEFRVTF